MRPVQELLACRERLARVEADNERLREARTMDRSALGLALASIKTFLRHGDRDALEALVLAATDNDWLGRGDAALAVSPPADEAGDHGSSRARSEVGDVGHVRARDPGGRVSEPIILIGRPTDPRAAAADDLLDGVTMALQEFDTETLLAVADYRDEICKDGERVRRKKRVRMHLVEPHPSASLPSVEGLLVSKRPDEFVLALPHLILAAGANPAPLESRWVAIPRERVAFYEVLT